MNKQEAVAALGPAQLLGPARLREALRANDRIKLVLTLLQAALQHAQAPQQAAPDLAREFAATDISRYEDARWLRDLPAGAVLEGSQLHMSGLARLAARLAEDLGVMAAPLEGATAASPLAGRCAEWTARLARIRDGALPLAELKALTHGHRGDGDSLHLLVMDLHKALNRLGAGFSESTVAGAHAWQLAPDGSDTVLVEAFMRGVQRTAALKLDHPGLDTSATRDGDTLLIQNDIGTNDAHLLVLQVREGTITLTYSDLHRQRFAFFQDCLREAGAQWSAAESRVTPGLNQGEAYTLGTATFSAIDRAAQCAQLEAIGSRIVFLIDWNRARKRLVPLVGKRVAVQVLKQAAAREVGHMAWLQAGGERLVWNAMGSQPGADFRLGDRLVDVLPEEAVQKFLLELFSLAWEAARTRRPAHYVADEARLMLARALAGHPRGFELLREHAALCHALAQGLEQGLDHGHERDAAAAERLAQRAKAWERAADELVMRGRSRAERQPHWLAYAELLASADEIADALEEATFVLSVIALGHHQGWNGEVRELVQSLARAVSASVQDHVRAVQVAADLGGDSDRGDHDDYLDALWRVLQAERSCDELHRAFRRAVVGSVHDGPSLVLANELAAALERASDALLAFGYRLRNHAFRRLGVT